MCHLRAAIFAALFLFSGGLSAFAQDVTLTARDGAVEISGTLLGFDGEFYRVDTIYGELTVDGTGVNCEGPGCPNLTDYVAEVTLSGAREMGEVLVPALVEAFALRQGYSVLRDAGETGILVYELNNQTTGKRLARFTIRATNSNEGFADLMANEADLVMSLREIREAEAKRGEEAGLGDMRRDNRSRVLALTALIPIAEPRNPVRSLSTFDLARVFAGEITNWQALGGADAPISLHLPAKGSGLLQAIEDELMGPANLQFSDFIRYHMRQSNLVQAVQRDPFAIGIASYEDTGNALRMSLRGGCGHEITATRLGIKTEDYPLSAPMYLYLPARRLPKIMREFLTYVRSPAAQVVIRRAGFVDQGNEEVPLAQQGQRLANAISQAGAEVSLEDLQSMMTRLSGQKRLTTTFRFRAGSSELDAHSLSNVQLLARQIERGDYDDRSLLFVGFSDGSGAAGPNQEVASRRARTVRLAVVEAAKTVNFDRVTLESTGFGEALPIACDDTAWGRGVNRRVEVWLR